MPSFTFSNHVEALEGRPAFLLKGPKVAKWRKLRVWPFSAFVFLSPHLSLSVHWCRNWNSIEDSTLEKLHHRSENIIEDSAPDELDHRSENCGKCRPQYFLRFRDIVIRRHFQMSCIELTIGDKKKRQDRNSMVIIGWLTLSDRLFDRPVDLSLDRQACKWIKHLPFNHLMQSLLSLWCVSSNDHFIINVVSKQHSCLLPVCCFTVVDGGVEWMMF